MQCLNFHFDIKYVGSILEKNPIYSKMPTLLTILVNRLCSAKSDQLMTVNLYQAVYVNKIMDR